MEERIVIKKESRHPLVSIMIPNYNYSMYLDECIQSALSQSYPNVEIIVLDNNSTDNSVDIAKKYIKSGVRVCKNPMNIFNINYRVLSEVLAKGKYMMLLCSDDYILPNFVEQAVRIMENHPNVGYVQGEKDFIFENHQEVVLDPFYRCSFIAPGLNMMPIYMVTAVAHPSQGIFRTSVFREIEGYDKEISHANADRTLWFYLSYKSDGAYIRDKMCKIRMGRNSENSLGEINFQHPVLYYLFIRDFIKFAKDHSISSVYARKDEAILRVAKDFLDICQGLLLEKRFELVEKYLLFAKILDRGIVSTPEYRHIEKISASKEYDPEHVAKKKRNVFSHTRGYEPPKDYIEICMED